MIILGIDPGFDGGITAIDEKGEVVLSIKMPTMGDRKNKTIDVTTLKDVLFPLHIHRAFIEKVSAMPGQGVTSMFTFGYNAGMLEGLLTALGIGIEFVRPQIWMNEIFKGMSREGKPSVAYCLRKYPLLDWRGTERSRIAHDGKTDSCCIAEYGMRKTLHN